MKLINKTDTTLIFNDINLVLMHDKNGDGCDVDDCDIKNSPTLKHYIERGLVEIVNPDETNVVYRSIKNRKEVVERQEKRTTPDNITKVGANKSRSSNSDIILGGQSEVRDSRVYRVAQTSSITKFRETGMMDIAYAGPCFAGDTIVITSDGVKFIKDITKDDIILTHKGNWKRVNEIHKKQYSASILELKPTLSQGISISCTPDHKFYVNKEDSTCEWKSAIDTKDSDYLITPYCGFKEGDQFLLLSDHIGIDFDEQQNGFCSAVKINDDFMRIVWTYINSGWIEGDTTVCFKVDKSYFFEFIMDMRSIFGVKCGEYSEKNSFYFYSCKCESLANFFRFFCGNEDKKIPSFAFRRRHASAMLASVLAGKEVNKKGTITIYSKHPLVAWGIRLLLFNHEVMSSIQYIASRKNYCVSFHLSEFYEVLTEAKVLDDCFTWKETSTRYRSPSYEWLPEGAVFPISSKEKGGYVEYVYNLDVEDDHSYTANFCAVHNCYDAGGYAKMNRNYMFGLSQMEDVNLKLDLPKDISLRIQVEDELVQKLDALRKNTVGEDCVKIFGSTATTALWGGYKILYTMMETEKVHPQYIEKCNMVNELWLPTDWCIEKFREGGLKNKIYKMPIGVDLDNYGEGMQPITFGGKENGFIFLSVFGWSLRKGYDILLQAYYEEFNSNDDVTLVICSKYAGKTDKTSKQVIKDDIKRIEQSVRKTNKPKPPLLVSDSIPEKMMGNLYNSAHAYICISRGEGFGMPYCEASICGLPVIASNCSGQMDFLNYDNSFLVEPEGFAVNPGAEWVSYYYTDMPMAAFGRKSIDQTRAHMRYVYENYALAKEKNRKLQNFIRENYNWDKCIGRMYDRLKEIYPEVKHRGER